MKYSAEQILKYMMSKYHNACCPYGVYILDYFIAQDLLKISEYAGRISGVIIFRKVKLSQYDDTEQMKHNPKGDCTFVVELCADTKKDIAKLEKQMRERIGKTRSIGMHRRGKLHFYDYNKYIKILLGKDKK